MLFYTQHPHVTGIDCHFENHINTGRVANQRERYQTTRALCVKYDLIISEKRFLPGTSNALTFPVV